MMKYKLILFILILILSSSILSIQAIDDHGFWNDVFVKHNTVMLLIEVDTGSIIQANQAASSFYGYTVDELTSMFIQDFNVLPPDEVEQERKAAAEEERNYFIFPHRLKNGEIRTVEVYSYPVDAAGNILYSIIHDVTARKKAEASIVEYNDRLIRAEKISQLGHWEFDLGDDKAIFSDGAIEILGLDDSKVSLEYVEQLILPEHLDMRNKSLQRLIERGEEYDIEFKIKRPVDGQIVDIRSLAEYDQERNVIFGTLMDITEYKQMVQNVSQNRNIIIAVILLILFISIFRRRENSIF